MTNEPIDPDIFNHTHAEDCKCAGDHCIFYGEDPYDPADELCGQPTPCTCGGDTCTGPPNHKGDHCGDWDRILTP